MKQCLRAGFSGGPFEQAVVFVHHRASRPLACRHLGQAWMLSRDMDLKFQSHQTNSIQLKTNSIRDGTSTKHLILKQNNTLNLENAFFKFWIRAFTLGRKPTVWRDMNSSYCIRRFWRKLFFFVPSRLQNYNSGFQVFLVFYLGSSHVKVHSLANWGWGDVFYFVSTF